MFSYKYVVLYVEPREGLGNLTTNTARTEVLVDSNPLPWTDWAAEFRQHLPQEIQELEEQIAARAATGDHSRSIRDRLMQIRDLFKVSRYRPQPAGRYLIADSTNRRGGTVVRETLARARAGGAAGGGKGGRAGDVYAAFKSDRGNPAEKLTPDPFPRAIWVSVADGTRAEGFLEDRAAVYLSDQNIIQINGDFRVFTDMVGRYCELYKEIPGAKEQIVPVVREWFEQNLIEAAAGILSLEGNQLWSPGDIAAALSDEALTAAAMPRYHIDVSIKRALGTKLGSLKSKE